MFEEGIRDEYFLPEPPPGFPDEMIIPDGTDYVYNSCSKAEGNDCPYKAVHFPASVKSILNAALENCADLKNVTFAEGSVLETIGLGAFLGTNLNSLHLPATLESIGEAAFAVCTDLKTVTFAEGSVLKRIEEAAFAETNLNSVDLPASLESIGALAFYDCPQLTNVTFNGSACYPASLDVGGNATFFGQFLTGAFGGSTPASPQQCASR